VSGWAGREPVGAEQADAWPGSPPD